MKKLTEQYAQKLMPLMKKLKDSKLNPKQKELIIKRIKQLKAKLDKHIAKAA